MKKGEKMKTTDKIAAALLLAGCLTIGDKPGQIAAACLMVAGAWICQRIGRRRT